MNGDAWEHHSMEWLLEPESPGVRFLALRDLVGLSQEDAEFQAACAAAYQHGPIATILAEMNPEGYWVKPGPGYNPKYRSSVWSVILLAQLGASARQDERVQRACDYILEHALAAGGQFSMSGASSGTIECLQGNLCWALLELGVEPSRLEKAFEWMARSVTGEGVAPQGTKGAAVRFYAGNCGPGFACGANNKLPCAWGGIKVMLALSQWPQAGNDPLVKRAIMAGSDFLLGTDPVEATYPSGYSDKPSSNWWKFGFPVFYVTDLLQNLEALIRLGYRQDPRLAGALDFIRGKQDEDGKWPLEYDYSGKTWVDFGAKKRPNKWVTLRALKVLKLAESSERVW